MVDIGGTYGIQSEIDLFGMHVVRGDRERNDRGYGESPCGGTKRNTRRHTRVGSQGVGARVAVTRAYGRKVTHAARPHACWSICR